MQFMAKTATILFGISLCCLLPGVLLGQSPIAGFVLDTSAQTLFWTEIKGFKPQPIEDRGELATFRLDSLQKTDTFCLQLLNHFRQKSFLLVSIDSTENGQAKLYLGPALRWVTLRTGPGVDKRLSAVNQRTKAFSDSPFRFTSLLKLQEKLLEHAENNGYPFARVWLDSVAMDEAGQISAVLQLDQQRFFVFKDLRIKGDVKLPKSFLPNYLGIKPGMPYSRARVLRVREQLRSLLFLESTANPSITFAGNPDAPTGEANINLFLKKKRASRFDFIIGLLPQPETSSRNVLLTGSLSAAFQNALNLGERFSAELERLKPETQKVDVQASVPYILGSSFGAEGKLGIFRRDSTWTDAQYDLGVSYLFLGADFVRFFWENKASSLQKVDTLSVLSSKQLPANLDYRQNGFGLENSFTRLDYRFNPRRGWALSIKAVAGFNNIRRNTQIENLRDPANPDFSFSSLYDTLVGRAARYRTELRGEVYFPILARSTIKIGLRGGGIFSDKTIFANENFRLGGNKLLRGFDEESLFATRFLVGTAEYRLLIGQNSFLSAFADWAYLENRALKTPVILRPLGLGAGLNFETRAGIFGISAAIGRRDTGQPLDFRATKFHLGYVSLF